MRDFVPRSDLLRSIGVEQAPGEGPAATPPTARTIATPINAAPGAAGLAPWPNAVPASGNHAVLPPSTEPVRPKHSRTVLIAGDNGGLVRDYVTKYVALGADGAMFRIDGRCASACTIVLAFGDRVCITKRAVLGFHQARNKNGRREQSTTDWMMSVYPATVRDYISARGGLPLPKSMMWVTGSALRGLVKPCE